MVDDLLKTFLAEIMVDDEDQVEALMGGGRALESFGARIQLARCFGLLEAHHASNLDTIRKLRNHAAHAAEDVTFADQKVRDLTNNLRPREGTAYEEVVGDRPSVRMTFIAAAATMLAEFHMMIAIARHLERPTHLAWMVRAPRSLDSET